MDLSLVEYPVPININSQYATIEVDSNPISFDLNDEVIVITVYLTIPIIGKISLNMSFVYMYGGI